MSLGTIIIPVSAQSPPVNFITREFLERVLKRSVESFTWTVVANPEGYTSLFALRIYFEDGSQIHLLMRAYPTDGNVQAIHQLTNTFYKELRIYDTLFPELTEFAEKSHQITLIPKCWMIQRNGNPLKLGVHIFVQGAAMDYRAISGSISNADYNYLDNCILTVDSGKSSGFKPAGRFLGLDFPHSCLVLNELAKLHAVSWAYKKKKQLRSLQDRFPFLREVIYVPELDPVLSVPLNANFSLFEEILKEELGSESTVLKAFRRFEHPFDYMLPFVRNGEPINEAEVTSFLRTKEKEESNLKEPWMVCNNGDCYVYNMLFKYDGITGKPLEVMLFEVQLYREACPTVDLAYFIYSSTANSTRKKYLATMLEHYSIKFQGYCKQLGVKPLPGFSLAELKRRFHRSKTYGLMAAIMLVFALFSKEALAKEEASGNKMLADEATKGFSLEEKLKVHVVELVQELYAEGVV